MLMPEFLHVMRASLLVIQPPVGPLAPDAAFSAGGGAIFPSSVMAAFNVTTARDDECFCERLVESPGFLLKNSCNYLYTGRTQFGQSLDRRLPGSDLACKPQPE